MRIPLSAMSRTDTVARRSIDFLRFLPNSSPSSSISLTTLNILPPNRCLALYSPTSDATFTVKFNSFIKPRFCHTRKQLELIPLSARSFVSSTYTTRGHGASWMRKC